MIFFNRKKLIKQLEQLKKDYSKAMKVIESCDKSVQFYMCTTYLHLYSLKYNHFSRICGYKFPKFVLDMCTPWSLQKQLTSLKYDVIKIEKPIEQEPLIIHCPLCKTASFLLTEYTMGTVCDSCIVSHYLKGKGKCDNCGLETEISESTL